MARNVNGNNMYVFKYIRSRKPAREVVEPLEDKGMKILLKDNEDMTEKLN